ncbi:hypothetical protein NDU88_004735 [Pleurodeles waltl]|uniref:Uncharacterized protein n=1 Tax=Pleurodeles waltl TaxID=8319 RepID=A0AAV7T8L2_PLEWA|nr:hypothetical protein NDU88_004735 [Pleurodeles waltl]
MKGYHVYLMRGLRTEDADRQQCLRLPRRERGGPGAARTYRACLRAGSEERASHRPCDFAHTRRGRVADSGRGRAQDKEEARELGGETEVRRRLTGGGLARAGGNL